MHDKEVNIEEVPSCGYSIEEDFRRGMGEIKDRVILLLEPIRIFDKEDSVHLDTASTKQLQIL